MVDSSILIVIPSFDAGGVEKALINLANGLSNYARVHLLVCVNKGSFRRLVSSNVTIIDLNVKKLKNSIFFLPSHLLRNKYNYVISGPTFCNLFLILAKRTIFGRFKLILTHHNYQDIEINSWGLKGKIVPFLIRTLYPFADKIVAVSYGIQNELCETFRIEKDKIKVIYNAVIDQRFYQLSHEENQKYDFGTIKYLLFIGRLEKVKNCSMLVTAFAELIGSPNFLDTKLIVVGDGSERENLLELSVKLQLNDKIIFLGAVDNPLPLLRMADSLINTSFSEALPIVLIEAMALNVKIVASDTLGAMEVLKNYNNARLFPIGDKESLKEKILLTLNEKDKPQNSISEDFESDFIVHQYLGLFKK